MPIQIDPTIKLPVSKKTDGNPLNDPKWIDPNTPLIYGPGSGRITSSSAVHKHRDLSYKTWNPELGEYEDISKFSKYGVTFSNYGPSWQDQRASGQSTGEKWSHGLKKAAITTGGAIVENTLGILSGVDQLLQGGQYHNNEIGNMVDGWNDWARKEMPNYYTEKEQNMGLYDRMGTANFWSDKVANGFGYTLGSLATVYLTGGYGLIGLSGKALNLGSKANTISKANKIYKLYKTAQGTKRGEKLLSMYNKTKGGIYLKNGLLTLEAGAMMSLAESSVEARETQKHIKKSLLEKATEKYPDGIPQSVLEEIENLSQSAGNTSFIGNMTVLSLSNIAMFNKFLAGNVTKQSLKSGVTGGGLTKTGAKTVVDKGSTSVLGRVRKWTKPFRRGMLIESIQEGGQYATNIASTEYYTSRFDNKGGITMMKALNEGVSRTFGETNGLESMMIGAIVGGISSGVTGTVGPIKQRNKLAARVQEIINDDAFMNIMERTKDNARTSHFLEKADQYRAEGKDKLADQAMTQAFISEISTLDNAGSLEFFTERLEDFKSLSDIEFKQLFGIAEDTEINKNEVIDNMLEETKNIVKRKNALDLMFAEEETRGFPGLLLGKKGREEEELRNKETAILKAQLLHQAVFLDQIDNFKKEKAKEIDSLFPGVTLSTLEEQADLAAEEFDLLVEQYIRNAAATEQVDENNNPITNQSQIPKDELLAMHNQAYSKFKAGIAESVKNINLTHPLDKDAMSQQLQEYYMLHRDLQDTMESWNKLQTNEGRDNYIRAALIDGEQSIKDANNRRADEVLDNESDPNAAMDNIPPNASKAKKAEIEEEVKRMKKEELALMNKYGNPEMSIEEIDRQLERLRQEVAETEDAPRKVKDLNFKIQVLETIKGIKLEAETVIKAEEDKKGTETTEEVEEEVEVEKTGRGRKQIDRIKKKYESAKQPQEKLGLIQDFINNVYQGAEATQEEIDFFNNEIEALKKEGFELQMETQPGNKWNEGMNVEVIWMPDDTLPEGVTIIDRVDEPGIMKDGQLQRRAKIVVKLGKKEGTERPALVEARNKAEAIPGTGKKKLDTMKKASQALSDFDNQFTNPFNLADLASEEETATTAPVAPVEPVDKSVKEFMKGSEVVDETGAPLLMYHGTNQAYNIETDIFDPTKGDSAGANILFITPRKSSATKYAQEDLTESAEISKTGAVASFYANVKNIFDWNNPKHIDRYLDKVEGKSRITDAGKFWVKNNMETDRKTMSKEEAKQYILDSKGEWGVTENGMSDVIEELGYEGYYTNTNYDINQGYADSKYTQAIGIFNPQGKIKVVDKNVLATVAPVEVAPIDKAEYEIHLEGNWGIPGKGWSVYDALSVPGIKLGDQRNNAPGEVTFSEMETENNKIFILTDRTSTDNSGRIGGTSIGMVFDKNTTRTLEEVKENLLNLNAEIQATRSSSSFDNNARQQIERLDMKETTTPTRNTEMTEEENTSTEDILVKTDLSAIEEDRLKSELETETHKDISSELSEISQIPIGDIEGYYQQLLQEEEDLKNRINKEDDDC